MDIVNVELLDCYYFATAYVSSRSRMMAHVMIARPHESQQHSPQTACNQCERLVISRAKMVTTHPPSSSGWVGNKDRAMEDEWQQKLRTLLSAQPEPRHLAEADENDCNQ
eukprot:scaffold240270_cov43-Attheya_sp.AAC.1